MKKSFLLCLALAVICINVCSSDSDRLSNLNGARHLSKKLNEDISISKKSEHSSGGAKNKDDTVTATTKRLGATVSGKNVTCVNGTCKTPYTSEGGIISNIYNKMAENKDMLLRTLYVLIGVTALVIVYFMARAWRLRRRRKARKYGIITTPASDLEMAPLGEGDDDEEDDMTVFEMSPKRQVR